MSGISSCNCQVSYRKEYHLQKIPFFSKAEKQREDILVLDMLFDWQGISGKCSARKTTACLLSKTWREKNVWSASLKLQILNGVKFKNFRLLYIAVTEWWPQGNDTKGKMSLHFKLPSDLIQTPSVLFYCCLPLHRITHIPQALQCLVLCSMSTSKGLAVHE